VVRRPEVASREKNPAAAGIRRFFPFFSVPPLQEMKLEPHLELIKRGPAEALNRRYIYIYMHTHTYTHTYIYIYIYIYIYKYK